MISLSAEWYLWLKALHVIAMVAWMAGLLYLPRLFVYHCEVRHGSVQAELFQAMERRLLRGIMNPALIVTYGAGVTLALAQPSLIQGWLHAKLGLVLVLTIMHMLFGAWRRDFAAGRNKRSARFYRFANEIPAVLMVCIVILVIVKPF